MEGRGPYLINMASATSLGLGLTRRREQRVENAASRHLGSIISGFRDPTPVSGQSDSEKPREAAETTSNHVTNALSLVDSPKHGCPIRGLCNRICPANGSGVEHFPS